MPLTMIPPSESSQDTVKYAKRKRGPKAKSEEAIKEENPDKGFSWDEPSTLI